MCVDAWCAVCIPFFVRTLAYTPLHNTRRIDKAKPLRILRCSWLLAEREVGTITQTHTHARSSYKITVCVRSFAFSDWRTCSFPLRKNIRAAHTPNERVPWDRETRHWKGYDGNFATTWKPEHIPFSVFGWLHSAATTTSSTASSTSSSSEKKSISRMETSLQPAVWLACLRVVHIFTNALFRVQSFYIRFAR